eukprot:CAMPEP_0175391776 /NCGR_PEP_ID=MMETSP0095-20121207/32086_1 /TAXON_ID=311494 /ORGANISM="Alexandrium monilatum, Strain CCMP3105" /LENGTH=85 /DNA_ID=CAMNT_0016690343 /DNA_START=61 /DNA_END=316 /DNA_ORIENTATION=-
MPELLALRPVNCTASALEPDCKLPLARPSDLLGKPGGTAGGRRSMPRAPLGGRTPTTRENERSITDGTAITAIADSALRRRAPPA